MNRDQRVQDNWALLATQAWAKEQGVSFAAAHNLVPGFLGGGERQWRFKLAGLRAVEKDLHAKGIPFYLFVGEEAHQDMLRWMKKEKIGGMTRRNCVE
jgi:deoxyribodipyrimidine photo-lyase